MQRQINRTNRKREKSGPPLKLVKQSRAEGAVFKRDGTIGPADISQLLHVKRKKAGHRLYIESRFN